MDNTILSWVNFLLFTPCPQHILLSSLHLIFMALYATNRFFMASNRSGYGVQVSPIQATSVLMVTILHWCITIHYFYSSHGQNPSELLFSITQALTWTIFATIVNYQSKLLRLWWITTFLLSLLTLNVTTFDGIVNIASIPVLLLLLFGRTEENSDLTEPLFEEEEEEEENVEEDSFISKAFWLWLTPLLTKKSKLELKDIPLLSREDRCELLYSRFRNNLEFSVRTALFRTFWVEVVCTGVLCVLKVLVMYVGPILITEFVNGKQEQDEGLVLVAILFSAKVIEALSTHQLNFQSQRLDMVVRSSLMTTVYTKCLRVSSFESQKHGAGAVLNYLVVDVQQVADFMVQIHQIWVLPLQVGVAILILYTSVGISCFGGFFVMASISFVSFNVSKLHRVYLAMIMKFKDLRLGIISELLTNIKIIKLQAWEERFKSKIEDARHYEQKWLSKFVYVLATNVFFLWLSPLAVSTFTFGLCVWLKVPLTPAKVFTAIATFRIVQEPLRLFPRAFMAISQGRKSFDRLESYICSSRAMDCNAVERLPIGGRGGEFDVEIEDASFKWDPRNERAILRNLNVKIPHSSFVAIVGLAGSGKSEVLLAVLGEMPSFSGSVKVRGRTAYVGQSAWIQNTTIKENILFGREFDESKYLETIRVCLLENDLAQLSLGDKTEVGERGLDLSEGQKQKVQLARAVYQDADVYLLADIFDALDAHTGTEIFKECIMGALRKKTVLLVTHQVEFSHGADLILVMRDGELVQSGKYNDLLEAGTNFRALAIARKKVKELAKQDSIRDLSLVVVDSCANLLAKQAPETEDFPSPTSNEENLGRTTSIDCGRKSDKMILVEGGTKTVSKKRKAVFTDNDRTNEATLSTYWQYATKVCKGWHVLAFLILQSSWQALQIASDYWLAHSTSFQLPIRFLTVYCELALGCAFFVLLKSMLTAKLGLLTAQSFFGSLLSSIVRAPMTFFDTTQAGRILSRFSIDQSNVDFLVPILLGTVVSQGFQVLGILVVLCRVTWQLVFLILPLSYLYILFQGYYMATSRELTHIAAVAKSLVIVHFAETISGFVTIRAFGEQSRFAKMNMERVNANFRMEFFNNAAKEWVGFRLEIIGTLLLTSSALFMVTVGRNVIAPELVGLALCYGLALNGCLHGIVYMVSQLDSKMVSVERIEQFSSITPEAPPVIENSRPAEGWPTQGSIQFERIQFRYRPDSPVILKGITFTIKGGEKVAVVGKPGSGKSTLIQALFRLSEPSDGRILIDNLDTRFIGVKDLRSKFGIVLEDPTLFEGSVRSNVDPLHKHSDHEIWEALAKCHLARMIRGKYGKLDSLVFEDGENWSVGQKQLICLARALLKKARILVFYEAKSSQMDVTIQKIIRREFESQSTVITIAQNIPRVLDSDKVLVLDSGVMREFDAPARLLENPDSHFAALVRENS